MGNFTRQVNVTEIKKGYVKYKRLNPEVISFGCFLQSSLMTHCKTMFCESVRQTQYGLNSIQPVSLISLRPKLKAGCTQILWFHASHPQKALITWDLRTSTSKKEGKTQISEDLNSKPRKEEFLH